MPGSSESPERHRGKLPAMLLWAGVGIAPLAALALILGSGDRSLRVAVGLALVAVVLIGLAIVLRPAAEQIKEELEDSLYDELDVVREDMRGDITTAARATHRAFAERFQQLQDGVEQMRGQVEGMRAEIARQEAMRGSQPQQPSPHAAPPRPNGPGVVRHTETVQVTTRSTIVDPHTEEPAPARGTVWGRRPEPAPEPAPPRRAEPAYPEAQQYPKYEESWTEQQLRQRLAEASNRGPAPEEPPSDERWSGVRSGDRWASVRADERGRELRMGERRSSMHADENGSEVRYEDRWTAMRREDPRYAGDAPRRREEQPDWEGRRGPRALPATSDEQSGSEWVGRWAPPAEPEPEPRRRRRYDDGGY
ncbi:hypothetical protein [Hamadaea tsunoensis]|uniref:hypothetical protein n=1 Tax=Hamadaea tsunoensis TaxID=53368 RepID=UPI00041CA3DD|nr:hypothetical protein [Hamadaea tsunoensis]